MKTDRLDYSNPYSGVCLSIVTDFGMALMVWESWGFAAKKKADVTDCSNLFQYVYIPLAGSHPAPPRSLPPPVYMHTTDIENPEGKISLLYGK